MNRTGLLAGQRIGLLAAFVTLTVAVPGGIASGQEGVFLTEEQAPAAVFPEAQSFARQTVVATPDVRARMRSMLGGVTPSIWEDEYVVFKASRADALLGYAIIVEEIGKHRPISFVVGLRPDGRVNEVAVMAYREAYGGAVKTKRFLSQYRDKSATDSLQPYAAIQNIAGATLSVEAASRAVRKAQALARSALGVRGGA